MTISKSPDKITIQSKINYYYRIIIMLVLACVIFSGAFINYLINSSFDIKTLQISLISIVFLFLLGNMTLWFVSGEETLIIEKGFLIHIRNNSVFSLKKKFMIDCIKNIGPIKSSKQGNSFIESKVQNLRDNRKAIPFWYEMGKISFLYNGNYKTILNGLTENEASEISLLLQTEINLKTN